MKLEDAAGIGLLRTHRGRGHDHLEQVVQADRGEQRSHLRFAHDLHVGHRAQADPRASQRHQVADRPADRSSDQRVDRSPGGRGDHERVTDVEQDGLDHAVGSSAAADSSGADSGAADSNAAERRAQPARLRARDRRRRRGAPPG